MFHIPITKTDDQAKRIEFCHINNPNGNPETWQKEKYISLENVKINVFVGGEFSVVGEEERFSPSFGDFCVLPPRTLHYGSIPRPTHLDYYQLDIGLSALDGVPDGRELLSELCRLSRENGALVRNGSSDIVRICENIEAAILKGDLSTAFSYVVIAVDKMKKSYLLAKPASDFLSPMVKKAIKLLAEGFASAMKIEDLAESLGVSESYLSRRFKKEVGTTPHAYVMDLRISESMKLLDDATVADVAQAVGFCDSSHFIASFKKNVGCTPSEYVKYRKKQEENQYENYNINVKSGF